MIMKIISGIAGNRIPSLYKPDSACYTVKEPSLFVQDTALLCGRGPVTLLKWLSALHVNASRKLANMYGAVWQRYALLHVKSVRYAWILKSEAGPIYLVSYRHFCDPPLVQGVDFISLQLFVVVQPMFVHTFSAQWYLDLIWMNKMIMKHRYVWFTLQKQCFSCMCGLSSRVQCE